MEELLYIPGERTVFSKFRLDGKRRRVVIAKDVDPEYGKLIAQVNRLKACAEAVVKEHTHIRCPIDCTCYICHARRAMKVIGGKP